MRSKQPSGTVLPNYRRFPTIVLTFSELNSIKFSSLSIPSPANLNTIIVFILNYTSKKCFTSPSLKLVVKGILIQYLVIL